MNRRSIMLALLVLGSCGSEPTRDESKGFPLYGRVPVASLNGTRAGLPIPKDGEVLTSTNPALLPRLKTSEQVKVYKRASAAVVLVMSHQIVESGVRAIGTGSGFIVSSDGLIVTNNHVIEKADIVVILLKDKASHPSKIDEAYQEKFGRVATIVARSREKDLALLKILEPPDDLTPVGPSPREDVTPALEVLAIGHPRDMVFRGDESPVSLWDVAPGMIRNVQEKKGYQMLVRHTAPINQGNSGGPLLNMDGNYVGVNTMKPMEPGFDGVYWSIGVSDVLEFLAKHDSVVKQDFGMPPGIQQCAASSWNTVNLGYLPAGKSASVQFTIRSAVVGAGLVLGYERAIAVLRRDKDGWVKADAAGLSTPEPVAIELRKPHTLEFRRTKEDLSILLDGKLVSRAAKGLPARGWAFVTAGNVNADISRE
jgi:S1-C subfamily serine protease